MNTLFPPGNGMLLGGNCQANGYVRPGDSAAGGASEVRVAGMGARARSRATRGAGEMKITAARAGRGRGAGEL